MTKIDDEWWEAIRGGKLLYQSCRQCGQVNFYPRLTCVNCLSADLDWRESTRAGTVHAFTRVHRAAGPDFAADVPYVVILADMDDGFRLMAKLRSGVAEAVEVGTRVAVAFEAGGERDRRPCFEVLAQEQRGAS